MNGATPRFFKNPSIAALLSVLWTGLGQIYNGEIGKGIALAVTAVAMFVGLQHFLEKLRLQQLLPFIEPGFGFAKGPLLVLLALMIALWVYGIIDANRTAKALNEQLATVASPYDRAKWQTLIKFDNDVAAAAEIVQQYGQKWVDELARAYLALGDKTYLRAIAEKTIAAAVREHDQLGRAPAVVEEGTYKGRKWRRYRNGTIDGELLGGRYKQFSNLEEFQRYIA